MGTITTDKLGFTEKALAFSTKLMGHNTVRELAQLLVDLDDYPNVAVGSGPDVSADEQRVAVRSALASKLMREGVLHVEGGG